MRMEITLQNLRGDLQKLSDPIKKEFLPRFFKTGKGEYGYGDVFLGVTVPKSRRLAAAYKDLPFPDIKKLLSSKIHEERLIALFILVHNFKKGDAATQKEIYDFYLSHTRYINNWDLVDASASKIVGEYLRGTKDRKILIKLANSKDLWEKRIAIIATHQFITFDKSYTETFTISEILITDKHDLIQKAVGWMLREVGKKVSREKELEFLDKHHKIMGRTALRYAIEHFDEKLRKKYMAK